MHIQGFLKIGSAALLSVFLVACSTTGDEQEAAPMPETTPVARPATPAPAPAPRQPTAQELEQQRLLAITVFYFDFDKAELKEEARQALVVHANDLKANPSKRVRLEGHADERGTREYNLALGERRAQAVERYLLLQGVSSSQLEIISYGEERPAQVGTTEQAYALNRRVEMK